MRFFAALGLGGAALGFSGLVLDPAGPAVGVKVFESVELPGHWARLDEFEGDGYRRAVASVETEDGVVAAWIYVLAEGMGGLWSGSWRARERTRRGATGSICDARVARRSRSGTGQRLARRLSARSWLGSRENAAAVRGVPGLAVTPPLPPAPTTHAGPPVPAPAAECAPPGRHTGPARHRDGRCCDRPARCRQT